MNDIAGFEWPCPVTDSLRELINQTFPQRSPLGLPDGGIVLALGDREPAPEARVLSRRNRSFQINCPPKLAVWPGVFSATGGSGNLENLRLSADLSRQLPLRGVWQRNT